MTALQNREMSKGELRLIKMLLLVLWLFVAVRGGLWLHDATTDGLSSSVPFFSLAIACVFVGIIAAAPVLVIFIFLQRTMSGGQKVLFGCLALVGMVVVAAIAGFLWLLSHMAP